MCACVLQVVQMLREDVLPHTKTLPDDFVAKVMHILNKGSIHSAASSSFIGELLWLAANPDAHLLLCRA